MISLRLRPAPAGPASPPASSGGGVPSARTLQSAVQAPRKTLALGLTQYTAGAASPPPASSATYVRESRTREQPRAGMITLGLKAAPTGPSVPGVSVGGGVPSARVLQSAVQTPRKTLALDLRQYTYGTPAAPVFASAPLHVAERRTRSLDAVGMILLQMRAAPLGPASAPVFAPGGGVPSARGFLSAVSQPRRTLSLSTRHYDAITPDTFDALQVGIYDLLVGLDRIEAVP